ncbi:aminofutalosine deaminase family hydrolase [Campylobacter curvus]|uniref:Metallo-dependent hydrolase, subgroup D n=1 Tax=Campylobacter curvus (strain 525.92) TaxID=360105 RepID=A7GZY6_CAMC5|nr:metal-dependent hydrolase [Campylobacter curvus]EAT99587.1 metallo-dependent hydrolase, subgroup D [Campylobacter curvus 525.92]
MEILKAKWLIVCDENFKILKDRCIAFDEKIRAIGSESELRAKFKNAKFSELRNSVIAPAFVNTHVHLEFSANASELTYGDFIAWLGSIVTHGGELAKKCTPKIMQKALNSMLKSGVGTVGAVSSFGKDLHILATSPARVVFFNEILGSNGEFVEQNWLNFMAKFKASQAFASARFTPAVSLHSPYSIHPDLAIKALNFAREKDLIVCTHFLESKAEKSWLDSGTGAFKEHLKRFVKEPKPMFSAEGYFAQFSQLRTLFTHCVYESDFTKFKPYHSITHCAVSNRLLGKKALDLGAILRAKVNLNIGTDGLSSNISLNFWDELRAVLLTHQNLELNHLAKVVFKAATKGGADALGINSGELKPAKLADIAVYSAPKCDESELVLQLILHTKQAKRLYIGGKICEF